MKNKKKIIVVVLGGVVNNVYVNDDDNAYDVEVLDYDNNEGYEEVKQIERLENEIDDMTCVY